MSSGDFLSKQNVKLIWDVLIDEDILNNKSKDIISQINVVFNKNIEPFYEIEKNNTNNLIELNKKFITLIINFVNKNFPNVQQYSQPQQTSQQTTHQPDKKELITYEDLQANRQNEFEKEFSRKQKEFSNMMTLQVPDKPNFSDNMDKPIGEMELEIKKIMAQRNYDLETINKSVNVEQVENWLKPKETSVKLEKEKGVTSTYNNAPLKYIKIDKTDMNQSIYKNEIIDLSSPQKKQISWADENIKMNIQESHIENNKSMNGSLFSKLKLLPHMLEEQNIQTNKIETADKSKIELIEEDIKVMNSKIEDISNKVLSILEILQKK
jgi:hypothetical protein